MPTVDLYDQETLPYAAHVHQEHLVNTRHQRGEHLPLSWIGEAGRMPLE